MSKRRQDSLRILGGDGKDEEEKEVEEEKWSRKQDKGSEILGARRENFDNLCPKLEEVKKNVIGGPKWHFNFLLILQMDGHNLANKYGLGG